MKKYFSLFFTLLLFSVCCLDSYAENAEFDKYKTVSGYYEVSPDDQKFTVIDGVLFDKSSKTLLSYPNTAKDNRYVISEGVQAIGDQAFSECHNLSEIMIPEAVTFIGENAFSGCAELTIKAVRGSYAEKYADENDIHCVSPDSTD